MFQPTGPHLFLPTVSSVIDAVRDPVSVVFNLPGYQVLSACDLPLGGRRVTAVANSTEAACPDCGVISARVHQRTRQRVKDLGVGGKDIELIVIKPRFLCTEAGCARRTFTQVTSQLPFRARCTARLKAAAVEAVLDEGMPIWRACARHRLGWATINAAIIADTVTIPDPDQVPVRALGIDEHRFARAKWFKHPGTAQWCRVEPWMSTFVNAATGHILGVVDGRSSANITRWLRARSQAWLEGLEVVAIDPSSAFRNAVAQVLPAVEISVDHWHVVRLGNQMLTEVRQRVTREV
ncbi:transposase, partial [Nesterenkonia aerolata]